MATQVRTLTFLPEIFQTEINSQFLGSTLDVLTSTPNLKKVNGLIGQKFGYGISGNDKYVVEPTQERNNYQLEPSVVFLKKDTGIAQDFIDYPGIINELTHQGGATKDHNRLFANEFYTWDSFTNLDKAVNYSMYYWLPLGPDAISILDDITLENIVGKKTYTTPSGLELINGLKIVVSAVSSKEYYVEGVGESINLVPVDELICTEVTAGGIYTPWSKNPWDTDAWSIKLYIPIQPDYIVMNRASNDRNPWSRGNRWFHQRVLDTHEKWNGQVTLNPSNIMTRAQRPIVEFEADLRLFNSGIKSAGVVDYIDTYTTNAEQVISGAAKGTAAIVVTLAKTTQLTNNMFQLDSVADLKIDQEIVFKVTPGVSDTGSWTPLGGVKLNKKYYIESIDRDTNRITVVDMNGNIYPKPFVRLANAPADIPSMTLTSVATVQSSAKVVFNADNNPLVRKKIYNISYTSEEATAVAVMVEVGTVKVTDGVQVHISDGPGNLGGTSWRFEGETWVQNQNKEAVNQAPLFDVFDTNDISLGDSSFYPSTSFKGTKILSYQPGVGTNDVILGFPVAYSSGAGGADYLFDVNLNLDTFTYKLNGTKVTKQVSMGFVHKLLDYTTPIQRTGWVKAIAPSKQYQRYIFTADVTSSVAGFICDIRANTREEVTWAPVVAYQNGSPIPPNNIDVTRTDNSTTVKLLNTTISSGDSISISVLSDQVSATAYYQVPDNLQNNAFNASLSSVALGEMKQHYLSIFNNAPGTSGDSIGNNNYADLGDMTAYGNRIIHSSASLLLPGVFLRKPEYNLQAALRYSADKYQDYKATMLSLAENSDYSIYQTPSQMLDDVINRLTSNKVSTDSFFWSDMLPSGSPYITNSYEYHSDTVGTVIPLSKVYDFENANYNSVFVYYETVNGSRVNSELLLRNTDYTISNTESSIKMIRSIKAGARIVIKEYNQTYGSYCPSTPSKLGLFPATTPRIFTDTSYKDTTTFIVGHDGSYTKLYGNYNNGVFDDFRDLILFEFEKRVYNNIKVSGNIPLLQDDIMPGQWRTTSYTRDELQPAYVARFLDWAGKNRINYRRQYYEANDSFSFNYGKSGDRLTGKPVNQSGWRGLYLWFFDTVNPAQTPWEMLGLTDKPTWWDSYYGPAPYTNGNTLMWQDIADGRVWNDGSPYIVASRIRPELLDVLPVDGDGNLLPPLVTVIGNYDRNTFKRDWVAGDVGPAEAAYLKSSTWPFDLMSMLSVFEPVRFYNYFVDRDLYKYNEQTQQFMFNERYHLNPTELSVYGTDDTTAKHSYINWVVDYTSKAGANGADKLATTLKNLDIRLTYRMAGFSDKEYLKFFTENSTPSATSANLLIPDDSFDLMLYDNIPSSRIKYSGVIIQKTPEGFTVWGNDLTQPHFDITTPIEGPVETIIVGATTAKVSTLFDSVNLTKIAYGTQYFTTSGVAEFLINYGRALEQSGVTFERVKNGVTLNWKFMVGEFLSWAQQTWETGSTINLNPAATSFTAFKSGLVVQPLTINEDNFVLNQNLIPISPSDIAISRSDLGFGMRVDCDGGDTIAFTNLNMSAIEHAIVFNNKTLFGDVIYNNSTGMRQSRIIMNGSLTAEWQGSVTATGFILNEGMIEDWNASKKYPKGQIVMYKNLYWAAQELVEPSAEFNYTKWKQSSYEEVKKGLLPNPNTAALSSENFYDIHASNLNTDADLLAFGLIGYKPRAYMSESQLSDITQVNAYRNMIQNKGTMLGANAFKGATMTQGTLDYTVHENWAIKRGEFGSVLNSNFVEALLDGNKITGNPGIIGFGDGSTPIEGVHQTITVNPFELKGTAGYVNDLINYGRAPKNNKFLPASSIVTSQQQGLPSAGYVHLDDVKYAAFTVEDLNLNRDAVTNTYRDSMVWLANHRGEWDVFTPMSLETTLQQVTNNFDGTSTLKFASPHGLKQYDIAYLIHFDDRVDGFYTVDTVTSATEIIIALVLDKQTAVLTANGIAFKMMSRRVNTTTTLSNRDEIIKYGQFSTHRSWVDQSKSGEWKVLANGPVYLDNDTLSPAALGISGYGISAAYSSKIGYITVDGNGNIYKNGQPMTNKQGGVGAGTKVVAFDKYVYCSSPAENLMYSYDFSGTTYNASVILKGTRYTIATHGTTDYTQVGAPAQWNDVGAQFTPETETVPACMVVLSNPSGRSIDDGTYLSGPHIVAGLNVVEQTHNKVPSVTLYANDKINDKYSLAKVGQQTIAFDNVTGVKVGDWVVSKYFPLGTKVQSINTNNGSITFNARLTTTVLDARRYDSSLVLIPGTDNEKFTFYRPVDEVNVANRGLGIYRMSEIVPLTSAMTTIVDPTGTNETFVAQPLIGTSFIATANGSGIIINHLGSDDYLGGTGYGNWEVIDGKRVFIKATAANSRYTGGTGTVSVEYDSFDIGNTTGEFAVSQDRTWLYVANSASRKIDVYMFEVDGYKLVDSVFGPSPATGFGASIATARDGSKLIVGAPNEIVSGSANAGAVYIYSRATENFLQSDRAVKIVPDQTYAITNMGGLDATSLNGWWGLGAGVRFRAHITQDDGVWQKGNIMTVGDATYGFQDVLGQNAALRILIGSYLSGHDEFHSVGQDQNNIITGTQVTGQFDSFETTGESSLNCVGYRDTTELTVAAVQTPIIVKEGQLVRIASVNGASMIAYNADTTQNMRSIPADTYVTYIKDNIDYTNKAPAVAWVSTDTYTKNDIVHQGGYIYKCIANTVTGGFGPASDASSWKQQYVKIGISKALVDNVSVTTPVSFREAGLRGRYTVSNAHNFSGPIQDSFSGSEVTAIKTGIEFVGRGYGSYVTRALDGTLTTTDKTGSVSLRNKFVINSEIPAGKAAVYVDNKLVPYYYMAERNGTTYKAYNYKITVDTVKHQSTLTFVQTPPIGSVIVVDFGELQLQQRTTSTQPRIGALYGRSVATNNWGAEVFVGAPYESSTVGTKHNVEGTVYRWTNSGQRYNSNDIDLKNITPDLSGKYSVDTVIYIDGFMVKIKFDNEASKQSVAERIAKIIDTTEPTNVNSSVIPAYTKVENGTTVTYGPYVHIENGIPGTPNDQVDITFKDITAFGSGFVPYKKTQNIYEYDLSSTGAFGYTVAVNQELNTDRDSLIVSAPLITSKSETTFDFIDDMRDDDTIFDNGATLFVDAFEAVGVVYQYDYLDSSTDTIDNPGIYTFGQYINLEDVAGRAITPKFGEVLAFNEGRIIVGSPNWYANGTGRVSAFINNTYTSSWHVDKQPPQKVDVNRLKTVAIYDTLTNTTLDNLDYIDPAQGKMLAVVEQNVDFIRNADPANYTSGIRWTHKHVGTVWLDTTNFRLMNYNQPDAKYNARYFGQAFPGSTADLYTWVESDVAPVDYTGPGYVTVLDQYNTTTVFDPQAGKLVTKYFYWVKNFGELPQGKTVSPATLAQYILNPLNSGIAFMGAMSDETVGLFNCTELIHENNSALHLGYSEGKMSDSGHSDWLLIQSDNKDSFLPGVPVKLADAPSSLYLKYLTSFMGREIDTTTQLVREELTVPDQHLSVLTRYGVQFRPRQTMFEDRELALKNIVQYANRILASFPATESRGVFFLGKGNTSDYWTLTDWWATGYDSSTKVVVEVDTYSALTMIGNTDVINAGSTGIVTTLSEGLVARVRKNGQGMYETYRYTSTAGWTRINVENGTIKILDTLYTTTPAPAQEIYWILRWITEQVFVDELEIENNNSLMMMFNFIQSNSPQQQNYLPWLNKTSLIDISHTIRQLLPYKKFQIQSSTLINGFISEIKPFHVFIKEFSYKYSGIDYFEGAITDFDLPAKFRSANSKFVTPVLKQSNAVETSGEYLPTNSIWAEPEYAEWFKSFGLSFSNSGNTIVPVTKLLTTPKTSDDVLRLESVAALPVSGSIYIGTELIMYTDIDRLHNTISGLTKTLGNKHYADDIVSLVTTPVMVMDKGRGYTSAPTITAHIDTDAFPFAPRKEATFIATVKNEALTAVTVVDSGSGYPATPELRVTPSSIGVVFSEGQVDTVTNEIHITSHPFVTGDSIMFVTESTSTTIGPRNYGTYYVSALNGDSIALYENYVDAIKGYTTPEPLIQGTLDRPVMDHFHIQSPFESSTPVFTTGDFVRVALNLASVNNLLTFSDSFNYYYIRIDEAADTNTTATANLYDYVSFWNTYEGAIGTSTTETTPVQFTPVGNPSYLQANTRCSVSRVARTDDYRIDIAERVSGEVSVVARLQAFYGNGMVRGLKTGLKFDRTTYRTKVIDWEAGVHRFQEQGWDTTTWNSGIVYHVGDMVVYNNTLYRCVEDTIQHWEVVVGSSVVPAQWSPGVTYTKGDLTTYNTIVYRALRQTSSRPTDGQVETFNLANWREVSSSDPLLTAADRVVGFYRPGLGMPGYTFSDLSQLMTGTKYPYQTLVNPEFEWGSTYGFVPRNVNTRDNTITLNEVKPTMASYQEVVYGSYSDNVVSTYTPSVTQTNKIGNILNVTVVDNYSLFSGQPISFIGDMIHTTDKNGVRSNVLHANTVYYVGNVDASNSTITLAHTSNLSQIANSVVTKATSIDSSGVIQIGVSLGDEWKNATVSFISGSFANVGTSTYYVSNTDPANSQIEVSKTVGGSKHVFTKLDGNAITTTLTGSMGVQISPTVPLANASGFTTISFVNRTTVTEVISQDPVNGAPMVVVTNTTEIYDNAAVKFGGAILGNVSTNKIYFVDEPNSDLPNNKVALKQFPESTTPDVNIVLANATGTMSMTLNMPYAAVTNVTTGVVQLAGEPTIKSAIGDVAVGGYGDAAAVKFTTSGGGGVFATGAQYYLANSDVSSLTFKTASTVGGTTGTSTASNVTSLYAVFNPYIAPVESSYSTGDQVKMYYLDPAPEVTDFFFSTRESNNAISLHTTSYDASVSANAVTINSGSVYGYLSKPQTIMQTAGPIAGVTGDIVPMTYEHNNPALGFGLTPNKTYWAKFTSPSTVIMYKTHTDAVNDLNRIPLLKQTGGQFTVGKPVTVDVPQPDGSTKVEIVGYNEYDSIIVSDNSVDTDVIVKGSPFEYGYGPEELVAGVVTDGVNFTVTTRPGATWNPLAVVNGVSSGTEISEKYGHTGFNMVRYTVSVSGDNYATQLVLPNGKRFDDSISFDNKVANPAVIEIYGPSSVSLSGRYKMAEGVDYTVDWINKVVTFTVDAATLLLVQGPRGVEVAVYEFGNGNQLLRGTSDRYPLRSVALPTAHSEIILDVPYEHIETPSSENFWLSTTVFINGKKVEYYDGTRPLFDDADPMFIIVPQRPFDPISDPYNPAKIVFTGQYDPATDFASFAITSNVLGLYQVLNVADTYQVPMTDDKLGYHVGKVGVFVNGIRKTLNTDYTITPNLTNGGSKNQLLTIKFTDGVVEKHDSIKITYGSDGLSIPTTEYNLAVDPAAIVTGAKVFKLKNFLGDNNYAPFADLHVIYDNTAPVASSLKNMWQARSSVDLYEDMPIIVSGEDTNHVIDGYPDVVGTDIISRIYYLRDVTYHNDNTLLSVETFGLYTFRLANVPAGPVVTLDMGVNNDGIPLGMTFTATDNLIVEVNGIRYNGMCPDIITYGGNRKPLNNNISLVYPAPVYSRALFNPDFLVVTVNGVDYLPSNGYTGTVVDPLTNATRTIKWATNFDPVTDQFAGMDGLLPSGYTATTPNDFVEDGFFDGGEGFDNNNIISVVFAFDPSGASGLTSADTVSIQYAISGANWSATPTTPYQVGDLVTSNATVYRNLTGATGTEPSTDHVNWGLISMSPPPMYVVNVNQDKLISVADWNSAAVSYPVGTLVYRNDKVYKSIVAISSNAENVDPSLESSILTWQDTNWNPQSGWTNGVGGTGLTQDAMNESAIGGSMTLYLPWLTSTDVVSVTSFGRTSQQSLKTQLFTDIIVTKITSVVEIAGIPTVISTGTVEHGLSAGDRVFINGTACPDLDGGQYCVDVVDAYTLELYWDESLTRPVVLQNVNAFYSMFPAESFVQLAKPRVVADGLPVNPAVINQPEFNLTNKDRLYVAYTQDASKPSNPVRYYLSQDKYKLVQTDYVNNAGHKKTVYSIVILMELAAGATISVTSMIPTASPSESRYRINATWNHDGKPNLPFEYMVDASKQIYFSSIYREPDVSRTYVKSVNSSTSLTVADPYALVSVQALNDVPVQYEPTTGMYYVEIKGVDSTEVSQIDVFWNRTLNQTKDGYYWVTGLTRTTIKVIFDEDPSDPLAVGPKMVTVKIAKGNKMIVKGEQMQFTGIELDTRSPVYGKITGIRHAKNVTNAADIQVYDSVQSMIDTNLMPSDDYDSEWYTNRTKAAVSGQPDSDTFTINGSSGKLLENVRVNDTIKFKGSYNDFGLSSYLFSGNMAVTSATYDNGTQLEFTVSNYGSVAFFIKDGIKATDSGVDLTHLNEAGYTWICINDAGGMQVGHTVNCSAVRYSIPEDTMIEQIVDVDSGNPSATKLVRLSNPLSKDLPKSTSIQSSFDQPKLAPNAVYAKIGEKIQIKSASGVQVTYFSSLTNSTTDMFTIVDSYQSPTDDQKWIIKIAEPVTVPASARVEVAIGEFDITAIDKGTPWAMNTDYVIGDQVTDTNGACWKCAIDHTSDSDNGPGTPFWTAGDYALTVQAYPDSMPTAWAPASTTRISYPVVDLGNEVYIVFKTMDIPLQLDKGPQATFLKYSVK